MADQNGIQEVPDDLREGARALGDSGVAYEQETSSHEKSGGKPSQKASAAVQSPF